LTPLIPWTKIEPWLERMNWRNQWSGLSFWFWQRSALLQFQPPLHAGVARKSFLPGWTAMWTLKPAGGEKGVDQGRPGIDGLGGGAHIWPIYQSSWSSFSTA